MNMDIYNSLKTPPADALKTITFGPLKGKSDISPQWRYEALTEQFGPCGIGWRFTVDRQWTKDIEATGETLLYVEISLYIKVDDKWSEAIPGWGGDFVIIRDKNGIHGNDEAMKMAVTDALGTAAKMIGLAADVYRGKTNSKSDSKYTRREERATEWEQTAKKAQALLHNQPNPPVEEWWRITNEGIEVKAKDGAWMNIDNMPLLWLEKMLKDQRFYDIRYDVQKRIDEIKGAK